MQASEAGGLVAWFLRTILRSLLRKPSKALMTSRKDEKNGAAWRTR